MKALLIGIAICAISIAAIYLFNTLLEWHRRIQLAPLAHTPLQRRLSIVRWYFVIALFILAIAALLVAITGVVELTSQKSAASDSYARASLREQYSALAVKPGLSLSATEQRSIGGDNPQTSEVFIIDATLKDLRVHAAGCTPEHLRRLVDASTIKLIATNLQISNAAIDARWLTARPKKGAPPRGVCAVKWRWVATTGATGRLEAVVALQYRDARAIIYRSKIVPYAIGAVTDTKTIYSLVTSIAVSLLSLFGVFLSAWLSRRAARESASVES
jgi:hypothetical protein